jgi:ABC-type Fe3+/spermidine/putrescine transport system ATPase subunit
MVFQNYALFPHMTVFDNVAYGMAARKLPHKTIRSRVAEILEAVQLLDLRERYPRQLSGGQQQRVALARALVIRPDVLLMDEPLSNLDAKLRVTMREEIRQIQQTLGITTIYVTHDQEEAMAVSDRVAIFYNGRLQQVDSPQGIYFAPVNSLRRNLWAPATCWKCAP